MSKKHTFSLLPRRFVLRGSHFLICKGLTLIEILVVLFIMGFIAISLYYVLNAGIKGWREGKERTDIIAQARVAMDRLTRELRATDEILITGTGNITFSTEITGDAEDERIKYYSSGSYLYRNEGDPGTDREIARNIDTFTLTYYSKDSGGVYVFASPPSTATERNSIWMVEIETKIKTGLTGEETEVDLRSTVQPRNYPNY